MSKRVILVDYQNNTIKNKKASNMILKKNYSIVIGDFYIENNITLYSIGIA